MNKYMQAFLDDNNLKANERFEIPGVIFKYFFTEDGVLLCETTTGEIEKGRYLYELLDGDYKIKKLSPIPSEKFIPKEKEKYWFVTCFNEVVANNFLGLIDEKYLFEHTLVFKTEEQAEDYKWFLDKVDEYKKPFELKKDNHYFYYVHENEKVCSSFDISSQGQGIIYFGDKENIEKFFEEVGEERIKKYMFDIWEEK